MKNTRLGILVRNNITCARAHDDGFALLFKIGTIRVPIIFETSPSETRILSCCVRYYASAIEIHDTIERREYY